MPVENSRLRRRCMPDSSFANHVVLESLELSLEEAVASYVVHEMLFAGCNVQCTLFGLRVLSADAPFPRLGVLRIGR
jgi:hypothetical protein